MAENRNTSTTTTTTTSGTKGRTTSTTRPLEKEQILIGHGLMATESIRLQKVLLNVKMVSKHLKDLREILDSIYDEFQPISIDDDDKTEESPLKSTVEENDSNRDDEDNQNNDDGDDDNEEDYELMSHLLNLEINQKTVKTHLEKDTDDSSVKKEKEKHLSELTPEDIELVIMEDSDARNDYKDDNPESSSSSSSMIMEAIPTGLSKSLDKKKRSTLKKSKSLTKLSSRGSGTKRKKKRRIIDKRKKAAVDTILSDCEYKIHAIETATSAIISEEYNFTEAYLRNSYTKPRYTDAGCGKRFDLNFNPSNANVFYNTEEFMDAHNTAIKG